MSGVRFDFSSYSMDLPTLLEVFVRLLVQAANGRSIYTVAELLFVVALSRLLAGK